MGLEVHVELATETSCSRPAATAGDEPNTNIDPVTLGLPGALPVLRRQAVELAMRIGLALDCTVQPCTFHRKNYFYPDMPKAYQISQYDVPLNVDGHLDLPGGVRVGIERAHLEEDTGKSTHLGGDGRIHGSEASLIDFNRAGVPLVEIVSRPDIRTSEQARQYVNELRAILVAVGASDAKMEEGSMRVDANVSVHKPGTPFGTRCEIKNVNSVRSLGRAIDYEAAPDRPAHLGEQIRQETRHWDEGDGRTHTLRSKEDADDYRYFLEPDLVPLDPGTEWIRRCGLRCRRCRVLGAPRWPSHRCRRRERGRRRARRPWQDAYVAAVAAAGGDAARALVHVKEAFAEQGNAPAVPAADLAALTMLETGGKLTATQAKAVLAELVANCGGDPAAIAAAKGFEALDSGAIEQLVDDAIAANPAVWEKYCAGDDKVSGALVGGDEGVEGQGRRRCRHRPAAPTPRLTLVGDPPCSVSSARSHSVHTSEDRRGGSPRLGPHWMQQQGSPAAPFRLDGKRAIVTGGAVSRDRATPRHRQRRLRSSTSTPPSSNAPTSWAAGRPSSTSVTPMPPRLPRPRRRGDRRRGHPRQQRRHPADHPAAEISVAEWDEVFDINARSMLVTTQVAAREMIAAATAGGSSTWRAWAASAPLPSGPLRGVEGGG